MFLNCAHAHAHFHFLLSQDRNSLNVFGTNKMEGLIEVTEMLIRN